jgi:hypothetical protein
MAVKASKQEDEFIARQEFERKRKIAEEKQQKLQKEEKNRLRELHHMRCPKCGMELIEIEYKGIKIDECSHCLGLWLDANELDQILALQQGVVKKVLQVFKA